MRFIPRSRTRRAAVALGVAAPAAAALAAGTGSAHTGPPAKLVVRAEATAVDGPCDARACRVDFTDGRFRGTPLGTGTYAGAIKLKVARAFPNGEGGICAPLEGRLVLTNTAGSGLATFAEDAANHHRATFTGSLS